jgi:hypothetical protein
MRPAGRSTTGTRGSIFAQNSSDTVQHFTAKAYHLFTDKFLDSPIGPSSFSFTCALVGSRLEFLEWTTGNIKLLLPPRQSPFNYPQFEHRCRRRVEYQRGELILSRPFRSREAGPSYAPDIRLACSHGDAFEFLKFLKEILDEVSLLVFLGVISGRS